MRDLATLPKAHLHLHLEGAMRPGTLAEFAQEAGEAVPPTRGFTTFPHFVEMYDGAVAFIRTREHLARVIREVVQDAAASGAVWIEAQANPMFYVPQFGTADEVTTFMLETGQAEAARLGIGFGLMLVAIRNLPPAEAEALAVHAAGFAGRGVVSFGLAADEALFPPAPFEKAFAIAREAGLKSAPHAGELLGPQSVVDALDKLGAQRVQHGVRAVEDPELVRRLAAEGTVLDVCPTSNVALWVVPEIGAHPLPALLEAGVRCSINGDDPLLFGPGLLEEYETARRDLGLSDGDLAAVAKASLEGSAAPAEFVSAQVAAVDAWLA
ncbi:adenosine deaminase [Kineococcus rhizosphaerae]|uniref:Adenosine deaminase n=1 Tax=Kineococcus rhizosphaerae TaxID=559628 RepID=A0A2T0R636_9ACTN|nr:adenosine deaminase [Kineococcus rhizosphaerae]PRY16649.1 adenosine deaminase [Kineococcus rhizosphaerae]